MMTRYEGTHRSRICLPCRLGLCRLPVWAIRGASIAALAVNLWVAHKFGAF